MKTNESRNDDEPLRNLLKEWKATPTLPPRFQEQVWRRIECREAPDEVTISLGAVFQNWLATLLPRPILAVSYLSVLLVAGATAGWVQARHETARVGDELSVRYVSSIDPYQPTR